MSESAVMGMQCEQEGAEHTALRDLVLISKVEEVWLILFTDELKITTFNAHFHLIIVDLIIWSFNLELSQDLFGIQSWHQMILSCSLFEMCRYNQLDA